MIRRLLSKLFPHVGLTRTATEIEWFQVSFDSERINVTAQPPGRAAWRQEFRWDEIKRICFKAEDMMVSDGIYVFTATRPESYAIPTEAKDGNEFWEEILRRGLFDPELAIRAAASDGGLYCWSASDEPKEHR